MFNYNPPSCSSLHLLIHPDKCLFITYAMLDSIQEVKIDKGNRIDNSLYHFGAYILVEELKQGSPTEHAQCSPMVMNAGEQYKSGRRIRTLCGEGQVRQNSMGIRTKAVKNVMGWGFFVLTYRNRTKEHNKIGPDGIKANNHIQDTRNPFL